MEIRGSLLILSFNSVFSRGREVGKLYYLIVLEASYYRELPSVRWDQWGKHTGEFRVWGRQLRFGH